MNPHKPKKVIIGQKYLTFSDQAGIVTTYKLTDPHLKYFLSNTTFEFSLREFPLRKLKSTRIMLLI